MIPTTESDSEGENLKLERHETLWLEDGNVVLGAKSSLDARRTIHFRVYKAVLARKSVVFRDMFAISDGSDVIRAVDEVVDGQPFIEMHDSAEDLEALLKYIYEPIHDVALTRPRHPDFAIKCRVILKLADKYGFDDIKKHLLERFRSDWPKSLDEWDYMDRIKDLVISVRATSTVDSWPSELLSEPVSAAMLALEYDIKEILPSILYEMHRSYAINDWDTLAQSKTSFKVDERGARWHMATGALLHLRDLVREEGQRWLIAHNLFDPKPPRDHACYYQSAHRADFTLKLERASLKTLLSSRDWLKLFRTLDSMSKVIENCAVCRKDLNDTVKALRSDFWTFLVEIVSSARQ